MDYSKKLNPAAAALKPSGIREFFGIAASRKGCLSLGVGEPDFSTPSTFSQAGINSIYAGRTGYTANAGLIELREAIARYTKRFIGVEYDPNDEIIITVGASEGIDLALRALCAPGDEILVPEPCFVCYEPLISLSGATPVPIQTRIEDEFRLTPQLLKSKITPKTKLLILAYPNNPTGGVMEKSDLEALVPIIKENDLMVLSDEIYGELIYGGLKFCSIASLQDMRARTVVVSGFSKYFAMTGWRLGYVCAPREINDVIYKIHQYAIMCASTAAQYVALAALDSSFENNFKEVGQMRQTYDTRRKYLVERLNSMGLDCFEPRGAFYAFPSVAKTGMDGEKFAYALLDAKNVAVVPGRAFGESGRNFVRISYAYSMDVIVRALNLMESFLKELG